VTETGSQPPLDFPELEPAGIAASADEFANIPSQRRRHPVIALAAAALALLLIYQVHDDLFFALSHSQARNVGDARSLIATSPSQLPLNQYVSLHGVPDRESGLTIDTAGSWQFTQFFRLLGTGSRVFVSRVPNPIPVEQAEKDVFVGRLVRFKDLSYQAAIRKYFAERVSATHFFSPGTVRDGVAAGGALPTPSLTVADLFGEKVVLASGDELSIDVNRPADVLVELPREKFPDVAAARAAIERLGGKIIDASVQTSDSRNVALVVTFPADQRDRSMSAVGDLDQRVRFRPMRTTYTTTVANLGVGKDFLSVKTQAGANQLPLDQIMAIRTLAKVQIPADALLLLEGDRPRDHLKTLVVVAFLLAFALVNLLALRART